MSATCGKTILQCASDGYCKTKKSLFSPSLSVLFCFVFLGWGTQQVKQMPRALLTPLLSSPTISLPPIPVSNRHLLPCQPWTPTWHRSLMSMQTYSTHPIIKSWCHYGQCFVTGSHMKCNNGGLLLLLTCQRESRPPSCLFEDI